MTPKEMREQSKDYWVPDICWRMIHNLLTKYDNENDVLDELTSTRYNREQHYWLMFAQQDGQPTQEWLDYEAAEFDEPISHAQQIHYAYERWCMNAVREFAPKFWR